MTTEDDRLTDFGAIIFFNPDDSVGGIALISRPHEDYSLASDWFSGRYRELPRLSEEQAREVVARALRESAIGKPGWRREMEEEAPILVSMEEVAAERARIRVSFQNPLDTTASFFDDGFGLSVSQDISATLLPDVSPKSVKPAVVQRHQDHPKGPGNYLRGGKNKLGRNNSRTLK